MYNWIKFTILIILTTMFLTLLSAKAEIIYRDINPDTTLSASVSEIFKWFMIDLNNDGIDDFYIKHFNPPFDFKEIEFYTNIGQKGEILVDNKFVPYSLNQNETIGSSQNEWTCTAHGGSSSALGMAANWVGKQDKFIGLRFKINNNWHYAWLRLSVSSDTSSVTVKDFAYNSTPSESIAAGQTNSTAVEENIFQKDNEIFIYPNPVKEKMYIRGIVTGRLLIFSSEGIKLFEAENIDGIDVAELTSGLYFIKIGAKLIKFVKL